MAHGESSVSIGVLPALDSTCGWPLAVVLGSRFSSWASRHRAWGQLLHTRSGKQCGAPMEGLFILFQTFLGSGNQPLSEPATVRGLLPMEASGFTSSLECPWFGGFKDF